MHGRADPPGRISREAHFTLRLEAGGCFQEADMAFLDQVGSGETVMTEAASQSNDKTHMRMG